MTDAPIHLWRFDLRRCRRLLVAWWAFCLAFAVVGFLVLAGNAEPYLGICRPLEIFVVVFLAVLAGVVVQSGHPGRRQSYLRARPVAPEATAMARVGFLTGFVLLPLLASCLPLQWAVDPRWENLSAFALGFVARYGAAMLLLAGIAAFFRTMAGYLSAVLLGLVLLSFLSEIAKGLARQGGGWIEVDSPAAAELLWESSLMLLAGAAYCWILLRLYRGKRPWLGGLLLAVVAVLAAMGSQALQFRHSPERYGWAVDPAVVNVEALKWTAQRTGSGFNTIHRKPNGGYSGWTQGKPPYSDGEERIWSFGGTLAAEGLDPTIGMSARLLDSRWIAPDGTALEFAREGLGHAVDSFGVSPPGSPTVERVADLLGVPIEQTSALSNLAGRPVAGIDLFAATTSDYSRYRTAPGRLEIRVRVDFYREERDLEFPLGKRGAIRADGGVALVRDFSAEPGVTSVSVETIRPDRTWRRPIGSDWSSYWSWFLFEPGEAALETPNGSSQSNLTAFPGLKVASADLQFGATGSGKPIKPGNVRPERLKLVGMHAAYLGSAEVSLAIEDLPLVSPDSLENP